MKWLFWRRPVETFLIWAPGYTHRSSGVRALYRLCHHLNSCGYPSAMIAEGEANPENWNAPLWSGPVDDSIVVYPEVVTGNPLGARRVVRWVLNDPGLLGGDKTYADDEMVFVYDPAKLEIASQAVRAPLDNRRVLWTGLIDPTRIYPDPAVPRTLDCSFTHKGRKLAERFPLPDGVDAVPLETITPDMAALGDVLRRTRTLYSYDHYSNVLREAHISGCDIRVVGPTGDWHDPRQCDCALNIWWHDDIRETYARRFNDRSFVAPFIRELRTRWRVAGPGWRPGLPF
ncbi:MAG TPA: hypothetical protein VIZ90_17910 [Rhizobiaceae bacterium]